MEPTIYSNDILLTERITPRFQRIKKGDIIIAKSPSDPQIYICKRVTGMPGDAVLVGFSPQVVRLSTYTLLCGMLLFLFDVIKMVFF
jgi:inner membrane protease subunit 1